MIPDVALGWTREAGTASRVRQALLRTRTLTGERTYIALRWAGAVLFGAVVVALLVSIAADSREGLMHTGVGFLWSGTWNPAAGEYGAGILVVGTLLTTAVAMVIVVPIGLGTAAFLSELAPRWLAAPLSTLIGLLAAVPSIVVGLWGLIVLTPVFANQVEPFLASMPVLGWLFRGEAYGPSILLASVVLAVMTLPTMVALSRTALAGVPGADREAALALGATRWQAVRKVVIPAAKSGIQAAVTLAVGRAMGESIAVAMVIGNRPALPASLTAPGATLGSAIVNQFAEASPGVGTSSVIALGAVLLLLTVAVNAGGQALMRRGHRSPLSTAGALR
jgi:phosphate transport system permease protein